MNKKPTILAVAALGSLALIGTGFAGWVIVANAQTTVEGNITAYKVADNRLELGTGNWDETSHGSIIFGKPKTFEPSNEWFNVQGDDVETENLFGTYTITVKSKNATDAPTISVWSDALKVTEGEGKTAYEGAIKNGYIAAPTLKISDSGKDLFSATDNKESVTLAAGETKTLNFKIEFKWGSHFGGENPFDFYKGKDVNGYVSGKSGDNWGDDANKVMSALSKIGTSTSFSFTLHFDRA